jgi:hypothetical protein
MYDAEYEELRSYEERRVTLVRDIRDLQSGHWQHFQCVGSDPWIDISDELLGDYRWELQSIERLIAMLSMTAYRSGTANR